MIFAAGLGTRLWPLTADRPKALVEARGKPLIQHVIERMKEAGVRRLVINVHHLAGQVEAFLRDRDYFGLDALLSDERERLLDTGGGLLKARDLFLPGLPVLAHNVDILSDVDLAALLREHAARQSRATLVVQPPVTDRVLRFDDRGALAGWENRATGERKIANARFHASMPFSFCGIQVLGPAYLREIRHRGAFSIIDEHLAQARRHDLRAFLHEGSCVDAGTPEAIARLNA
ncbi:MAG: nucleotidyltransferase family protein [Odoribacteraceae bacterium]|jgi:NDP-sugar pyrophosphorylase family protein|nr:nucleotidyltransferase family protein [Odoribacteraceae bacterium]